MLLREEEPAGQQLMTEPAVPRSLRTCSGQFENLRLPLLNLPEELWALALDSLDIFGGTNYKVVHDLSDGYKIYRDKYLFSQKLFG
jgi:hypothetical protein